MLWQQCLNQLENILSDQEINTWLRTLHGTQHNNILVLLAPNPFVLQYVQEHHLERINELIKNISADSNMQVILQIGSHDAAEPTQSKTAPPTSASTPIKNTPFSNQEFSQETSNNQSFKNNIDKKLTFDNFVEGKSNQLGVASAKQVGESPGDSYNPLCIYGGVGLGKTHIMHAIGNRILELHPDSKVLCLTSERFVNDMINALRTNKMEKFKDHYRSVDALLIDDIQFFSGKNRSMEEFFHTFNALLEGQKQIILTSDRYPRDVEDIDDRLRSRLNSGLTVEISPPELETRVAILNTKLEQHHLVMPKDAAFFIAKRFRSNIRDLEGALQRVLASLRLHQTSDITLDFVHDALRDQLASQDKMVTVDNIKKTVAQHYNIKTSDMESKRRTRSIARPRQMAMALSKELTNHSLPEIGVFFGGRDHTTVLHACRKIKELISSDTSIEESYRILERTLTR